MYFQSDNKISISLANESVDLIIIDPPFSIGFNGKPSNYNRKSENVEDDYTEWDLEYNLDVARECHRILKKFGTIWLIMGWTNLRLWECAFRSYFHNQIGHVIWKYQFGVYAKRKPTTSHYHLMIYTKKDKKWTWNQQGYDEDVWIINRPYQRGGKKYPNKLPDELVENIIIRSSNPGDVIYDCFVGSGTTVKIANELGRIGIGSDIKNNKLFWRNYDE